MRYSKTYLSRGFSIIELMIVVAIIGIIAAFALPSYQNYATESRRTEGTSELMRIMDLQERFYTNQFPPSYTTDLTILGYSASPFVTEDGNYSIAAAACASATIANCVQLTATAQNAQAGDGNITLDSRGNRSRGGNSGWD